MITLTSVYRDEASVKILYDLLKERTPEMSISHQAMPSFDEHAAFVRSVPYFAWYIVRANDVHTNNVARVVGAIYLTLQREVGIFIFKHYHGKGYGWCAIEELRLRHPGRLLANISPNNGPSLKFFRKHGARLIQCTYQLPEEAP